ncbi:MAG: cyclophilin-like family protein [Burkholderiales bacterium]|jgi:hypothetical protein
MKLVLITQHGDIHLLLHHDTLISKLKKKLPIKSVINTWGDEVYFELPVKIHLDAGAQDVVEPGTVCFWVEGNSLAIPFGPTPASVGNECRLVTRVNKVGKTITMLSDLAKLEDGDIVEIRELLE